MFAIYETASAEALEESRKLQKVEATVLNTQRCQGKSLCYVTVAEYHKNEQSFKVEVAGEIGRPGTAFPLWVIPGCEKGFISHAEYIEQATAFLPLLLLPLAVFLFPIFLAVAAKFEKSADQKVHGKNPA